VVPDDIGGRYSVLTAVGLLPICAAGIDIAHMMNGAAMAKKELEQFDREDNMVLSYAAIRNALLDKGLHIEIFVAYRQCMQMFNEWLKQLFGESEGKEGKGIFPASVINTTDLHSMGQYIQEGQRILFETVIDFAAPVNNLAVPAEEKAQDGLEYLVGKKLFDINRKAMEGTRQAHLDGKVPNLSVTLQDRSSASFGYAVYFFELVCAISGYTLPIDPFNQPGVELYKKNMFRLLGKAGY
jgi:glucose-6-phosphate isomerase